MANLKTSRLYIKVHNAVQEEVQLNEMLGLKATRYTKKGDIEKRPHGTYVRPHTTWEFDFMKTKDGEHQDVFEALGDATRFIQERAIVLKELRESSELELTFVIYMSNVANTGFFLDRNLLASLHECGIEVDVDIYNLD